jgi:hypothetical protein
MILTRKEFKKRWESKDGGNITFDDIADCAKDWGLYSKPKICPIHEVGNAVLKAAGCKKYFKEFE